MRIKREFNTEEVNRIIGTPSRVLADRCPDLRQVFPNEPCTNRGCPFAIRQAGYMNCTFVGAEAGGSHTLDEIGDAMDLTRERVRQIEVSALRKLRMAMAESQERNAATVHQPDLASGDCGLDANGQFTQSQDEADFFSAMHGRKLAQSRR